ncbi:hypothetical protein SteCoe_30986 [Stentor coeruleus]|uniref:Uncharacterized protein n=1 Tax=Stentor coeruleus TaxID=5963 RepID=A0A1R2B2C6_9CILI|nr:hypothetical protein SteCoe_30986 [Stentor coeruleus]
MDPNSNLIVYLYKLLLFIPFSTDATWILINPMEEIRNYLIKQSKKKKIKNCLIYQDFQFKDQDGVEFNHLEGFNPLKTYFFIDTLATAQEFAHQIPEYSFVIGLNKIESYLNGIVFDENKFWKIIFKTSPETTITSITPISVYRFLITLNKIFKELIKTFKKEVFIAVKKASNSGKSNNFNYFYDFEAFLPTLKMIKKKIVELGYVKKTSLEELIDLMHALLIEKCYEKIIIVLREFIVEGIIEKIKNLIVCCKSCSKDFFEEFENLSTFLCKFPISYLLFKTIKNLEASGLYISFIVDYFSYSNFDNLLDANENSFSVRVIDESNEKNIFEIIKGDFTNHMMKLLQKRKVMKRLKKINKIPLNSSDEEKALEVLRQNIKNLSIEGFNEGMYEIITKHGNSFFAYPNEEGLEFMIKETIPKTLLILSGKDRIVKFIGKTLIGGKIALKSYSIDKIKRNARILSNLILVGSDIEIDISNKSEAIVYEEENDKIKALKFDNSGISSSLLKNSTETEEQKIDLVEKKEFENIINIEKPYNELSYFELNQLQDKINVNDTILLYNNERFEVTKFEVIKDKLTIAKSAFFIVLAHEIFHSMRSKFATNLKFSNRAPEKNLYEAGMYIDKAVYGSCIQSAKLNPQRMTLTISKKVLEIEDLTEKEANSIFSSEGKQKTEIGGFGCDEFEDDDEWMCTGRLAMKRPIRID